MLPDGHFVNRCALVTGGGSGIGRAIARALATLGASVALVGRREEMLKDAADAIRRHGGTAEPYTADVRDSERLHEVVREAGQLLGPVDLLVNSAAGNFRAAPESLSPRAWDAVVRIVLDGTWNATQAVCRPAIERHSRVTVLNVGTVGALHGGPQTVHSASAKAGVVAMTKSLARAWGPHGIRLNLLTPGLTNNTPGAEILWQDAAARDALIAETPLGRPADLSDVVNAALFLLSDFSAHVTGQNLVVDGGRSLGRG